MMLRLLFGMTGGVLATPCDSVIVQTSDATADSSVSQIGDLGGDDEVSQ